MGPMNLRKIGTFCVVVLLFLPIEGVQQAAARRDQPPVYDSDGYRFLPFKLFDTDADGHLFGDDIDGIQDICRKITDYKLMNESGKGYIEVFVIDSTGKGLKDARIFIDDEYKGMTDAEGKLTISTNTGTHKVRVEAEGYPSEEESVNVELDMTTMIMIEMNPESVTENILSDVVQVLVICISLIFFLGTILYVILKVKERSRLPRPPPIRLTQRSFCPFCRAKVQANWIVCPYCGANLEEKRKDETQIY
ncbi:MAG: carboxypeptidase regulatory-like domain-containing protein [Theionarchaea archaeon]|nr:carboxypeptidase regulatory-like domain-containing protein [Theionarchaea archaeon]